MHSEGDFKKEKEELAKKIRWILEKGKSIYEKKIELDAELENGNMCTKIVKFNKIRNASSDQHEFEVNCMLVEKEFKKLQMVA